MRRISNRALLERVLGQCDSDNQNVRITAFEKAREILAKDGLRLIDLLAQPPREEAVPAPAPPPPPQPQRRTPVPTGPYLHERVTRRFAKWHDGKRIIRNNLPPPGTVGRLRILGDENTIGIRTLTLSFETGSEIYEPYQTILYPWKADSRQQYEMMVGASRSGSLIKY